MTKDYDTVCRPDLLKEKGRAHGSPSSDPKLPMIVRTVRTGLVLVGPDLKGQHAWGEDLQGCYGRIMVPIRARFGILLKSLVRTAAVPTVDSL